MDIGKSMGVPTYNSLENRLWYAIYSKVYNSVHKSAGKNVRDRITKLQWEWI